MDSSMVLLTYESLLGYMVFLQMSANTNNVAYFQQYFFFSINKQNVLNKCVAAANAIYWNTFTLTNSLKDHVFIELGLFLSGYILLYQRVTHW